MLPAVVIYLITFLARIVYSGKELYKQFLSIPGTNLSPSRGGDPNIGTDPDVETIQEDVKPPHLECMFLHLGGHTRDNDEVRRVSTLITAISHLCACMQVESSGNGIVTVIATLAVAHEEAITILPSSDTLMNALVSRINYLTSLIWEDDPRTMCSSELINITSRALSRTLPPVHESPASSVRPETKDPSRTAIGRGRSHVQRHIWQAIVRRGPQGARGS